MSRPEPLPLPTPAPRHALRARRLGIESQHEPIAFMRADCPVGRSEGVAARAQVELHAGGRSALATLYLVTSDILATDEVGLSEAAVRHASSG